MKKEFSVLVSCMNQEDLSIIRNSNIRCEALVINQTRKDITQKLEVNEQNHRMISTPSKGLSVSRNLALKYCSTQYALLCDDDEVFINDVASVIVNAFKKYNDDILIFDFEDKFKDLGGNYKKIKKFDLLKISSWQIAFNVDSIKNKGLKFDERLGAGTNNGAGEENDFLLKAYKSGLSIAYVPQVIGKLIESQSSWFTGYDEDYFVKRGASTRYILGFVTSSLYAFHFLLMKRKLYISNISFFKALRSIFKGILSNKLAKK